MSKYNQTVVCKYAENLTAKIISILSDCLDENCDEDTFLIAYKKVEKLIASETISG